MAREGRVAGVPVVALEWHVDYWNDLGWADPFSSASYTERQQQYAAALGAGRVYTPQLVVDGRADVVGSAEGRARGLIEQARMTQKARIELEKRGTTLSITAQDVPGSFGAGVEVYLVIAESGLSTAVPRGENSGQTLQHGPVVRQVRKLGKMQAAPFRTTAELTIDPKWRREQLSAVVFLQRVAAGPILGAAQISL